MNSRSFTLLEVTIVLLILSLVGSLVAVQVKKMIDFHRFEAEVTDLFIALQEAEVIAATWQTDLALDLFVRGGSVSWRFSTNEPLSSFQLKQDSVLMPHVSALKFQQAIVTSLHIDIYSGGRIEPRGILGIFQKTDTDKALWFDLQHGLLLKYSYQKPKELKIRIPSR